MAPSPPPHERGGNFQMEYVQELTEFCAQAFSAQACCFREQFAKRRAGQRAYAQFGCAAAERAE
jgi:hypothetical protein